MNVFLNDHLESWEWVAGGRWFDSKKELTSSRVTCCGKEKNQQMKTNSVEVIVVLFQLGQTHQLGLFPDW